MRHYISFIGIVLEVVFITLSLGCFGQWYLDNKRDYTWIIGYGNNPPNHGKTVMNFNSGATFTSYLGPGIDFQATDASISDENGNLLFCTNGMFVADNTHTIMPHGDSINAGYYYNLWSTLYYKTYRMLQGALILPAPGLSTKYYIFHERFEFDLNYLNGPPVYDLLYTQVDMTLHNGLGDVDGEQKNVVLIHDTLDDGYLTAVRHGNGRDWWVLIPQLNHGCYYRILISPYGISNLGLQCIGKVLKRETGGQAVFSPDGSKYVRYGDSLYSTPNHLEVFSFDRCAGYLSNYVDLSFADTNEGGGVSISPNSRYLYYSNQHNVYQYDLQSVDINLSKQTVATWDGFIDTIYNYAQVSLLMQQLGPDGKVYIEGGVSNFYSTIESPDSGGIACNVQQHSLLLSAFNNACMPNFPNYRLHNLPGSPCDTLIYLGTPHGLSGSIANFSVFPNPASDIVNFRIIMAYDPSMVVEIYNIIGEKVTNIHPYPNPDPYKFDVSKFSPGLYLAILKTTRRILGKDKFCVIRN